MKPMLMLAGGALLLALPMARGQTVLAHSSSTPPPPGSALPPPGINDPGAKPQQIPLPNLGIPPSVAPAAQENAKGQPPPDVAVSTDASGDKVETYSRNGHVYMVRLTPKNGVPQTYHYGNPNGSLTRDPKLGPVAPVYYTIYKWGGPSKPASASSGG